MTDNDTNAWLCEFDSLAKGVKEINRIFKEIETGTAELTDAFVLVSGKYFVFIQSENPVAGFHLASCSAAKLKDFLYHLEFTAAKRHLYVAHSNSLIDLVKVSEAAWESDLQAVELRKPVAAAGYVIFTGDEDLDIEGFTKINDLCPELSKHFS